MMMIVPMTWCLFWRHITLFVVSRKGHKLPSTFKVNFIHLHLGLPNGLSPPGSHPNTLYVFSPPYVSHCLSVSSVSHYPDHIWQITNFVTVQFSHPSAAFSFWCPDVFLSTLLSRILNQCSSRNVRDKVAHPHKKVIQNCNLHVLRDISLCLEWFPAV